MCFPDRIVILFLAFVIISAAIDKADVKKCLCYVRYQQLFCQYAKELYFGHLISSAANCSHVYQLRVNMHPKIQNLANNRLSLMSNLRLLSLRAVGLQKPLEPNIFHGLIRLHELYLDGPHDLKTLRAHTFQFTPRLTRLGLSRCGLQTMESGAFCELNELVYLDLSYNRLLTFSCGWLSGLTRLSHLNLWDVVGKHEDWTNGRGNVVPTCFFCPVQRLRYIQLSRIYSFENDAVSDENLGNYDIYGVASKIFDLELQATNKFLIQEPPTYQATNFRHEFCNMSCEEVHSCSWFCQRNIVYPIWVYTNPIESLVLNTTPVSLDPNFLSSTTSSVQEQLNLSILADKSTISLETKDFHSLSTAEVSTPSKETFTKVPTTAQIFITSDVKKNKKYIITADNNNIKSFDKTNLKTSEDYPLSNLFIVIIIISVALLVLIIVIFSVWWGIKNRTRRYSVKDYHIEPVNL